LNVVIAHLTIDDASIMKATVSKSLLLIALTASPAVCEGQEEVNARASTNGPAPVKRLVDLKFKHPSFTFVRIQYSDGRPGHPSTRWMTDYPGADLNFTARFQKETGIPCERDGRVMTLTNSELSRFPFIYIAEGGRLQFSDAEVSSLRRYLLGGGFLMVDDFWGETEWSSLRLEMKRVFPEREPVELSINHQVFHCYYDIRAKPQVPNVTLGTRSQFTGVTWEREDAREAHYRGLFDDKGRLMVIFCHNTDLGDGWERESENEYYYREFSLKKAYPMGINIVVYALTQ
jgi:hypothetical protein